MKGDQTYDYIGVFFDGSRKDNFRTSIDAEYKSNRQPLDDDLRVQIPIAIEATKQMGFHVEKHDNFESDDLLASYTKKAVELGHEVHLYTNDKDMYQLVSDNVFVIAPAKENELVDAEMVVKKFGVKPTLVTQAQALMGDKADNIKGVPGIGKVTASNLLNEYGSLDGIIDNLKNIKGATRKKLEAHLDDLEKAHTLVSLRSDLETQPFTQLVPPEALNNESFLNFLERYELKTIKNIVQKPNRQNRMERYRSKTMEGYQVIEDEAGLHRYLNKIIPQLEASTYDGSAHSALTIRCMQSDSVMHEEALMGISMTTKAHQAVYIKLIHDKENLDFYESLELISQNPLWSILKERVFSNPKILLNALNMKREIKILKEYGVSIKHFDDTHVISYVLNAGKHQHDLKDLIEHILGITDPLEDGSMMDPKDVQGMGQSKLPWHLAPLTGVANYSCQLVDFTQQIYEILKPKLLKKSSLNKFYESLDKPLVKSLAAMEIQGVFMDIKAAKEMQLEYEEKIEKVIHDILTITESPELNVNSVQQLGEALFEKMGYAKKYAKKSAKTGKYLLNNEILEKMKNDGHRIAELILEYRSLLKLYSTYVIGLQRHINPRTGRIHPSYMNGVVMTGRLSCTSPNLQNIPSRSDAGRRLRTLFIAPPDHVLLKVDYSQVELRILAHVARIDILRKAFHENADIHATTAASVFNKPVESVEKAERNKAKSINFGIIYGMSEFGLAKQIQVSVADARKYIAMYFKKYPGIKKYMSDTKSFAEKYGYVNTYYGRQIHIVDINATNRSTKGFAERTAVNAPIQGTSADITKNAMNQLYKKFNELNLKTRMIMQIHDEIVFECPKNEMDEAIEVIKETMEMAADAFVAELHNSNAPKFSVPLPVDVDICKNWLEKVD
eukprot:CAMPEP_0117423882 /NCGR_PEP_ID=MMETSP0758-20121206/4410_1 /TAXON_ID=63605 /ORGANISM="Percolomonas cosmopolitus, Strain AE-1 (ATCC 50343)" /LENGTH=898 /DNA_ID=CAMNT_0005207323 /DNA_START=345 /DNA_END=3041 /DNA_ORIENTATION=-